MVEEETYQVKLTMFEGPLDLLLYLIKKNEVDIYDIPISLIVEQYLSYLDLLRSLNLEVAGDFLVMAATLSYIKSQMLIPEEGGAEEEEEEGRDPRAELVRRLVEYQRYKEAAEQLLSRPMLGRDVFLRPGSPELMREAVPGEGIPAVEFAEVGVFELLSALKEVMERAQVANWHEVTMERISIMDRIQHILGVLREVESVSFDQLFTALTDRPLILATFIALLELIRLRIVKVHQDKPFTPIHLMRAVPIDETWLTEKLPNFNGEER